MRTGSAWPEGLVPRRVVLLSVPDEELSGDADASLLLEYMVRKLCWRRPKSVDATASMLCWMSSCWMGFEWTHQKRRSRFWSLPSASLYQATHVNATPSKPVFCSWRACSGNSSAWGMSQPKLTTFFPSREHGGGSPKHQRTAQAEKNKPATHRMASFFHCLALRCWSSGLLPVTGCSPRPGGEYQP